VAHILELIESSLEFCVGCLKQDGNDVQAEPELMSHEQTVVRDRWIFRAVLVCTPNTHSREA